MKTVEEKADALRQQVNSKVIWGARDREVLDWLEERHGITEAAADEMLAEAHRAKCAAVRRKALLYLVFSIPGMLLAVAFIVFQSWGGFIILGYGSVLLLAVGLASIVVFFRSLFRLLTGRTPGSVN